MMRVTSYKVCIELVTRLNVIFMTQNKDYIAILINYDRMYGETIALFKKSSDVFAVNYAGLSGTCKAFIDQLEEEKIITIEESNHVRGIVPTEFTAGPLTPNQRASLRVADKRYGKKS